MYCLLIGVAHWSVSMVWRLQKKRMEREGSKPGEEGSATTGGGKPPHTRQYTIHATHTILDRAMY